MKRRTQEMVEMIEGSMEQVSRGRELTEEATEARRQLEEGSNLPEMEAELWKQLSDACFDMKVCHPPHCMQLGPDV